VQKEEDGEIHLEGGRPFNYCETLAMQHRICMRQATLGALLIRKHADDGKKHTANVSALEASDTSCSYRRSVVAFDGVPSLYTRALQVARGGSVPTRTLKNDN